MNVLVTGGAGYIGSVTTAELVKGGHRVTVYDNLYSGYRAAVHPDARFVHGDIHNRPALDAVLSAEPFDGIMHFAAYIEAGESMLDPGRYFENNTAGALNLIRAAVAHHVPRFVFSSTAAIFAGSDEPIAEDAPQIPANVYGHSKLMIEHMLGWFGRIHGLHYACLRYFNACGASDGRGEAHRPESHLIPLTLQVALGKRDAIKVYGTDYPTPDGTCIRDYIHIVDLAQAHVLAVDALETRERLVYNLGNGAGYSVREVIEAARKVTGHPIPAVETPRRPGDAPRLVAASGAVQRDLGWKPECPDLHDIIESAWEWHQAHPQGY